MIDTQNQNKSVAYKFVLALIALSIFGQNVLAKGKNDEDRKRDDKRDEVANQCFSAGDKEILDIAKLHLICTSEVETGPDERAYFLVTVVSGADVNVSLDLVESKGVSLKTLNCMYSVYRQAKWPYRSGKCEYTVGYSSNLPFME